MSPNEAIKNNVLGTYKMAKASAKYGVKRFVLISTDKATDSAGKYDSNIHPLIPPLSFISSFPHNTPDKFSC